MDFFAYFLKEQDQVAALLIEHIYLTAVSVGFAVLIGVPLGVLVSYVKNLNKPILGAANLIQAIPSMALLGFAIPFLGIGTVPAVVVVILYSLLPIIKNTYTGIENINPQTIEAAKGIGMTNSQILLKVQIPLALPVIMAGVRISAVTAVGLMTIAAFIGAGGLGYLVFSGIRTVNNNQILLGAIPACVLALAVDALGALFEKLVTPVSLQNLKNRSPEYLAQKRKKQKFILAAAAMVVAATVVYTAAPDKLTSAQKVIAVGTKDFTEQQILGHLIADLIEAKTDISVERRINLGGTQVCFAALRANEIDLYIEYSGTAYGDTLKYPPINDTQEVYNTVKKDFKEKFEIDVLKQMSFNNTYTLSVSKETATKFNLKNISDLAEVASSLSCASTLEFLNRTDGLPGLTALYNFEFAKTVGIDGSSRYIALQNQEVDVVDAFATDGLLKKFDLLTLKDDKNFFPPYYAMPIIRQEAAQKYPEIIPLLETLGALLTDETMIELNYQVDELQMRPDVVAREFLLKNELI